MATARRSTAASPASRNAAATTVSRRSSSAPAAPRQPHPAGEPTTLPTNMRQNKQDDNKPPGADKPASGRTTKLGRKTESPASIKTAGPSGQKGKAQHQKLHANK